MSTNQRPALQLTRTLPGNGAFRVSGSKIRISRFGYQNVDVARERSGFRFMVSVYFLFIIFVVEVSGFRSSLLLLYYSRA